MKRSLILLLLLLVAIGIYYFIDDNEASKMSQLRTERAFSIDDLGDLHKIVITEKNKKSIILERNNGNTWWLNNKYLARKNAMDNLLEVIQQVQIKYIPEKSARENILKEIKTIGVQVDLYKEDNNLLKSYQVGGSTQDERGTYMIMNDKTQQAIQPFVMQIPSIEGSVRGRFILSESNWRDRSVINEDVGEIKFIKVEYPSKQDESFTIRMESGKPALYSLQGVVETRFDQNKVKGYTQGFDNIYAEYIDNLNPLRDSISNLTPFSIISFGKSESDHKVVKLFSLSDLMYENEDLEEINTLKVEGRYFVDCSWGDFMLVQHRLIGKLLRGKSFFELNN